MAEQTLFEKIAIRMGKLASRSDVVVRERRRGPSLAKTVKEKLPDDMAQFYSRANGYAFLWSFVGETVVHGLNMPTIDKRLAVHDMVNSCQEGEFAPVSKNFPYGGLRLADKEPVEDGVESVLVEGALSASGVLMLRNRDGDCSFYSYSNDQDIWPIGETFTEAMSVGLKSGYAFTWIEGSYPHPECQKVLTRLSEPAEARTNFEVTVDAVDPIGADEMPALVGRTLKPSTAKKVLKLLGYADIPRSLADDDTRGQALRAALNLADPVDSKTAGAVLRAMGRGKTRKKDFDTLLGRGGPLQRVQLTVRAVNVETSLWRSWELATLLRILALHPKSRLAAKVNHSLDALAFLHSRYQLKVADDEVFVIDLRGQQADQDASENRYDVVVETNWSDFIRRGDTWTSTALPSIM